MRSRSLHWFVMMLLLGEKAERWKSHGRAIWKDCHWDSKQGVKAAVLHFIPVQRNWKMHRVPFLRCQYTTTTEQCRRAATTVGSAAFESPTLVEWAWPSSIWKGRSISDYTIFLEYVCPPGVILLGLLFKKDSPSLVVGKAFNSSKTKPNFPHC